MVVQYQPDDGLAGVVRVYLPKQADELDAAVAVLYIGKDVFRVQIGCAQADGLYPGLLVDADGVDRIGSCIMNSVLGVDGHPRDRASALPPVSD